MKKTIVIAICCSLALTHLPAQPPIRVPQKKLKKSFAKKIKESTVFSKCSSLASSEPINIKSSSGAFGFTSVHRGQGRLYFILPMQKIPCWIMEIYVSKYATQDFERGTLGFPLQDVKGIAGLKGGYQDFEGGSHSTWSFTQVLIRNHQPHSSSKEIFINSFLHQEETRSSAFP